MKYNEEVIIKDFEEYLRDEVITVNLSFNWFLNDFWINKYIETSKYFKTTKQKERAYNILDNYCCKLPF